MSKAARIRKPGEFRVPTTVASVRLCRVSHMIPRSPEDVKRMKKEGIV